MFYTHVLKYYIFILLKLHTDAIKYMYIPISKVYNLYKILQVNLCICLSFPKKR